MSARGFLGAGDLYISRYVSGAFEDWAGPYECTKLEIKPNVDLKQMVSKSKAGYGQVIEAVAVNKPADFSTELAEVNKESLAIALLGTAGALAQASGSLVDSPIVASLDKWVALPKASLTGSLTVKNSAGSTTYVNGEDYIVNPELGWVKALSTGAITDAESLKVSGAYNAISGTEIRGATSADVRARFKLDGINQADGLPTIVTIYEVVISPDQALDFLSDNFASVSMKGFMKTPAGYTEPFVVHQRDAAAS